MAWFWRFLHNLGHLVQKMIPLARDYFLRILNVGLQAAANRVAADIVDATPRIARSLLQGVGVDDTEG